MQKGPSETSFSLNNVLIDPSRNLIGAHDDPMRVEPKVMALLVRLKESMGQTSVNMPVPVKNHSTLSEAMHEAALSDDGRALHKVN